MNYIVAADSETGGLDPKTADMLTFYMAFFDEEMKMVDELDLKLKPDNGRIPIVEAQALKVNKIDLQAHLADPNTITYSEAKVKIITMMKKYLKKNGRWSNLFILGQNIQFDLEFIWEYLIPKSEWTTIMHHKTLDTMHYTEFLKRCGWFPSTLGTLATVVDYLGLPNRDAHNAREDTLMCVDVYKALIDLMKSKKNNSGGQDIITLLEAE